MDWDMRCKYWEINSTWRGITIYRSKRGDNFHGCVQLMVSSGNFPSKLKGQVTYWFLVYRDFFSKAEDCDCAEYILEKKREKKINDIKACGYRGYHHVMRSHSHIALYYEQRSLPACLPINMK